MFKIHFKYLSELNLRIVEGLTNVSRTFHGLVVFICIPYLKALTYAGNDNILLSPAKSQNSVGMVILPCLSGSTSTIPPKKTLHIKILSIDNRLGYLAPLFVGIDVKAIAAVYRAEHSEGRTELITHLGRNEKAVFGVYGVFFIAAEAFGTLLRRRGFGSFSLTFSSATLFIPPFCSKVWVLLPKYGFLNISHLLTVIIKHTHPFCNN